MKTEMKTEATNKVVRLVLNNGEWVRVGGAMAQGSPKDTAAAVDGSAVVGAVVDEVCGPRLSQVSQQNPSCTNLLHRLKWLRKVEPWPEPVDGKALLDELAGLARRFLVLPKWAPETLALWSLHTHAFHLREVCTYLGIESPEKRCGKTTLLKVLCQLANRPVVAANVSSPAFFRVIEELQPTLLIDEADTFLQGDSELRGILNSGYSQETAYVLRVANERGRGGGSRGSGGRSQGAGVGNQENADEEEQPGSRLAVFSCWCPKAIAMIGRLPDTLGDRCIVLRMQRKTRQEHCERVRKLKGMTLKQKCARFVADHAREIAEVEPEIPESLNDRAADIWEPLLALADVAGGEWPKLARQAAEALTASAQESDPMGSLILDIAGVFSQMKRERLFSRTLTAGLNGLSDRPWEGLVRGTEVTERWLSRQLRPHGVLPRTIWVGGVSAKGYAREDFEELFRRYTAKPEQARDQESGVGNQESVVEPDSKAKTAGQKLQEGEGRSHDSGTVVGTVR